MMQLPSPPSSLTSWSSATALALVVLSACTAPQGNGGSGEGDGDNVGDGDAGDGDGDEGHDGDGNSTIDVGTGGTIVDEGMTDEEVMEDCDATLELIVRDFNADHPDMQADYSGRDDVGCGMVMTDLLVGADGSRTPVFQSGTGTAQRQINSGVISCIPWGGNGPPAPPPEIESEASFNQWFTNVDTVNSMFSHVLTLTPSASGDTYYYDSKEQGDGRFFPADGLGFNELVDSRGAKHNFHFTTEAHVRFGYFGGEKFTFSGDDDMWIFVNGKLALDLGGLHAPLSATIDFDAQAADLGIKPNNTYNMDIFHAERHTDDSNYRIETNISCFTKVDVPVVVVR